MSIPPSQPRSEPAQQPPQPPQPPQVVLDLWMTSVTVIRAVSTGSASQACRVGSATGFFFRNGDNRYLITNRHVVLREDRSFYPDSLIIRVHTSRSDLSQNRDVTIPLYDSTRRRTWLEHPTRGANIDVVAINIGSQLETQDFVTFLSAESFLPSNVLLSLGDLVLVVGYPMEFYDTVHNFPITKTGTLASPHGVNFRGSPYFLIDAGLQPGMSGSPVILPSSSTRRVRDERGISVGMGVFPPHILGINSGEHSVEGIKLGLNVVWYSGLIQEIVAQ